MFGCVLKPETAEDVFQNRNPLTFIIRVIELGISGYQNVKQEVMEAEAKDRV